MSFDEIKSGYIDKLAKEGIKDSSIKKDQLQYDLMGYDKDGIIIEFEDTSIGEMPKFLKISSVGVSKLDYRFKPGFSEEQMTEFANSAFTNAKKKAEAIAKKKEGRLSPLFLLQKITLTKRSALVYGNTNNHIRLSH